MEYMHKDVDQHISKRELVERFATFSHDLTNRLEVRPTIEYLRKVLLEYDKKIELIHEKMQS